MAVGIRKGDRVRVRSGKQRGKEGEVLRVLPGKVPGEGKVIVDGANLAKRHTKPVRATMQGGIIDKDMPIPIAKVSIICSHCGPTRIRARFDDQERKVRVCAKCGGDL